MLRRSSSLVTINLETSDDESGHPRDGYNNLAFRRRSSDVNINCYRNDIQFKTKKVSANGNTDSKSKVSLRISCNKPDAVANNVDLDNNSESGADVVDKMPSFLNGNQGTDVVLVNVTIANTVRQKVEFICEKLQLETKRSYLQTYFLYANGCGVSPFHFNKENQTVEWLKKVPYYLINTLAAIDTYEVAKTWITDVVAAHAIGTSEVGYYMRNANLITKMMLRVSFVFSLKYHRKKFEKAVDSIASSTFRMDPHKRQNVLLSAVICCTSVSVVVVATHYNLQFGLSQYVIANASRMRALFCFHESCSLNNHPDSLDVETVLLGILGWSTMFSGNLLSQCAWDGVLFAAITLGKVSEAFKYKQNKLGPEVDANQTLQKFAELKRISKRINSAFKATLRMYLLANIFMLTVFVDQYFNPGIPKLSKLLKSINVVFVMVALYNSSYAANRGEKFREWMLSKANREWLGLSQMDTVVEALSPASTGFGRGSLYINEALLIGLGGVVAAYFFGIVETRPQMGSYASPPLIAPNMNDSVIRMLFGNRSFSCYED
ncbi:unnamed protein product [Orchesella dallaii]|uniref:Uncharacterized protein n=1 Tax=Orchesella dallaii TaxID=48710 RepID=A0ABP1RXP5_9HEXA